MEDVSHLSDTNSGTSRPSSYMSPNTAWPQSTSFTLEGLPLLPPADMQAFMSTLFERITMSLSEKIAARQQCITTHTSFVCHPVTRYPRTKEWLQALDDQLRPDIQDGEGFAQYGDILHRGGFFWVNSLYNKEITPTYLSRTFGIPLGQCIGLLEYVKAEVECRTAISS